MKRSALIVALALSWVTTIEAQVRQFPYEAAITQDETYVRSGPGTRYYPTSRLARGTKVTVHRHDPGGWYMIAPPSDSFSWIRSDYVSQQANGTGTVTENQVVVRVGTTFGDTRDVEQKRLSRGDRVQILGEKVFQVDGSSIAMYKIAPPRGEYRWVPGQFVASQDSFARQDTRPDPFETPVIDSRPKPKPDPFANPAPASQRPVVKSEGPRTTDSLRPGDAVVETTPVQPKISPEQLQQLSQLDAEFRKMVHLEIPEWNFVKLEEGYRKLQAADAAESLQYQLDQRFAALAKYQKIKDQYDDFVHLTEETAKRDAEILRTSGRNVPPIVSPQEPKVPAPVDSKSIQPIPETNPPVTRSNEESSSDAAPKLAGAGIVSRAVVNFPGAPRHLLLSPDGRMLAFLLPQGNLDLDRYAGHAMGVVGTRSHRDDLQADVIVVESVVPVRLK
jgi:Bacterial SH3 domain